jgi:alkanesulfonate monooxygenase SsuD/methylene tetrahydromethanopterin reductase-like flavin-dependent oxidoreductase (luciferase family)
VYVSIHMSPQSRGEGEDALGIEAIVQQSIEADAAGVAAICLTEHHLAGFNTYSDPFMLGSYLAGKLEQAYIAIHIVQVPLHHPVRIIESANILDQLTKGRLMLGLAPGSVREIELDVFGVELGARSAITRRRIERMLEAWAWQEGDPPIELASDDGGGRVAARIHPSSYRKPHPLLGRATMTDATIVDTAQRGWPLILGLRGDIDTDRHQVSLYRETLERTGHDAETVRECLAWLSFVSMICVADSEQAATRMLDEYVEVGGAGPIVTATDQGLVKSAAANGAVANEWRSRQLHKAQVAVAGTPEMIVEHLLAHRELGLEHVRVSFVETPGRYEQNLDSVRLFLEEVLPRLEPQSLPGPSRTLLSQPAGGEQ